MPKIPTKGYGASNSLLTKLTPIEFTRDEPAPDQVVIDILYCGVCHSDLHQVKNDWKNTIYPCVPGHEIIGKISSVGRDVKKFKVGQTVGVGCMIDSCGQCEGCREGLEQYCEGPVGFTATYNGYMQPKDKSFNTYGGYSTCIVVKEAFVLSIPETLAISAAAPILCAGITTYSPMKHWGVGEGTKVAIVGLGGLGHMAVKLARALGAYVSIISATEEKKDDASRLGASEFILSTDSSEMKQHELKFDFILNTIPDEYDMNDYVPLLRRDGVIVACGLLGPFKEPTDNNEVAMHRRSVAGTLIGGIAETQEVLDFCAKHNILPDVEMIRMQDINDAFSKMMDKEVRYRYVIDMESLRMDAVQEESLRA